MTKKNVCEACGADVRPDSAFCYNCGGPVAVAAETPKPTGVSSAWFQGDLAEKGGLNTSRLESPAEPIVKPTSGLDSAKAEKAAKVEKVEKKEDAPLKSASSMRRKSKTFQPKTVGIIWEEPDRGPNKWFPLVAFALVLFVIGIFFLANYLK